MLPKFGRTRESGRRAHIRNTSTAPPLLCSACAQSEHGCKRLCAALSLSERAAEFRHGVHEHWHAHAGEQTPRRVTFIWPWPSECAAARGSCAADTPIACSLSAAAPLSRARAQVPNRRGLPPLAQRHLMSDMLPSLCSWRCAQPAHALHAQGTSHWVHCQAQLWPGTLYVAQETIEIMLCPELHANKNTRQHGRPQHVGNMLPTRRLETVPRRGPTTLQ